MRTEQCSGRSAPRPAGRLDLVLDRIGGITRPRRSFAHPPIQLSRARYDQRRPEVAGFTLLHLGGVLAGDRSDLCVELGAGAAAHVRMAAATQVYRMPDGDAAHTLELRLGPGSRLDWLAEPVILFGGACFAQTTRITLAPGARLALLEVLAPGRLARGELHQFKRYAGRLEIYDSAGRCLAAERALLEPQRRNLAAPGLLAQAPVLGSLYMLGDTIDAERGIAQVDRAQHALIGATALPNDAGLLVRTLGDAASPVHARLLEIWGSLESNR
jgi:urease accessory protein